MADPVPSGGRRYVVLAVVIMLLAALPFSPLVDFQSSKHIDKQSATMILIYLPRIAIMMECQIGGRLVSA